MLFDPGNFSHGFEGITGLAAILITHQHPDHADTERLPALLDANPQAALYADPQTAAQLGGPWQAVHVGDEFTVGILTVRGVGGRHAVIHPEIPVIDNISYLIGDGDHPARLMHPGDALFTPGEPVDVLATPAAAPWMKISEAVDYLRAVAPDRAVPIHQAIIDPNARGIYYGRLSEMTDTDFQVLDEENGTAFYSSRCRARPPGPPPGRRTRSRRGRCPPASGSRARRRRRIRPPRLPRTARRTHAAVGLSTRESRSVSKPPNDFRVRMCSFTAISGPAFGSVSRCGATTRLKRSAEVAARGPDRRHLAVLGVPVGDLTVARGHLRLDGGVVERCDVGHRVHLGHQVPQRVRA